MEDSSDQVNFEIRISGVADVQQRAEIMQRAEFLSYSIGELGLKQSLEIKFSPHKGRVASSETRASSDNDLFVIAPGVVAKKVLTGYSNR